MPPPDDDSPNVPVPGTPGGAPSPLLLRALAEHAEALTATLDIPPLKRRARMVEFGVPRHVYRFRGLPRDDVGRQQLEGMLLNNELFAATPDKFNDAFDAQVDFRIVQRGDELRELLLAYLRGRGASEEVAQAIVTPELLARAASLPGELKANHQILLQQLGVCCFSATSRDPALWGLYAQENRGIALQYVPSADPEALQLEEVRYNETYPVIDNFFDTAARDLYSPLLRKAPSWAYEQEWRLFRPGAPNEVFQVKPEALTGVLLGVRISDADRDHVLGLVDRRDTLHGVSTRVHQAEAALGKIRMRKLR